MNQFKTTSKEPQIGYFLLKMPSVVIVFSPGLNWNLRFSSSNQRPGGRSEIVWSARGGTQGNRDGTQGLA